MAVVNNTYNTITSFEEADHGPQNMIIDEKDNFSDGASIFNKFQRKFGEVNKRPGFMQIVKLDSQVCESDRNGMIMTPHH